jgi:hypothetical protein
MMGALALGTLDRTAEACGGCFVQQSENTEVSGHRMVLSVSTTQTTLWDQITYSGNPSEFAWVLPIHGQVDVGLSSDALFQVLDQSTRVQVQSPSLSCPPPTCPGAFGATASATGAGAGGGGGGVTVIAQQVVGPYETVQLSSTDPQALATWLAGHGYQVPADVQPVISAYVDEGFDFLALRLVPGAGIDAMKPVRVTSKGASPALPLRMVAAGTGATTPITLWIVGEGRYETTNMPTFQIAESELVWDWDTQSSNYAVLRQQGFAQSNGSAWLVEMAEPVGTYLFQSLLGTASYDPVSSGYGDGTAASAMQAAQDDVDTVLAGINPVELWVTRVSAELSRPALAKDLTLGASADQSGVSNFLLASHTVGATPSCPPPPTCGGTGVGSGGYGGGFVGPDYKVGGGSGCAVSSPEGIDGGAAGAGAALALLGFVALRAGSRRRA